MSFHRVYQAASAAAAAFAAKAHAAFAPDLAALASSPWGAWSAFAIAISLVIVLLLWYAVDDDALNAREPHADDFPPGGRRRPDRSEKRRPA